MNQGWECPRCFKIHAPDVKECFCPTSRPFTITYPQGPYTPVCTCNWASPCPIHGTGTGPTWIGTPGFEPSHPNWELPGFDPQSNS